MKAKVVKLFSSSLYAKEFVVIVFCYLLTEPVFAWTFSQSSFVNNHYVKLLSLFVFLFMLARFQKLKPFEKILMIAFCLLIGKLFVESLVNYGHAFRYFELYTVLFPVVFVLFTRRLFLRLNLNALAFTANFYLAAYVVFMLLFGRHFSLALRPVVMDDYGPFSGDTRIVHAQSLYLMLVPFLWYLHQYLTTARTKYLFVWIFCLAVVVLHQHRSVWSSAMAATVIYLLLTLRARPQLLPRIAKVAGLSVVLSGLLWLAMSQLYPALTDHFTHRFAEILHPAKTEGTASFRINQSVTYLKYVEQKPVLGWGFQGYELKNPLVDWWPPTSGQHFHVGYVEMLFYHGVAGLLLKYSFLVYILVLSFQRNRSEQFTVLAAFCLSGFVFSLCYVLPLMFWAQAGMCLYYQAKSTQQTFRCHHRTP